MIFRGSAVFAVRDLAKFSEVVKSEKKKDQNRLRHSVVLVYVRGRVNSVNSFMVTHYGSSLVRC